MLAMRSLRSALAVFALFIALLSVATDALQVSQPAVHSLNQLESRAAAKKEHNIPPCKTNKKLNIKSLSDSESKKGFLEYNGDIVKRGNEVHKANKGKKPAKSRSISFLESVKSTAKSLIPKSLVARANGQLRAWHQAAELRVPTDGSNMYIWDFYKVTSTKDIEDQIVSTEDLSGCTVLIVASPLAVIMIHIWERRDNDIVSGTDQQGWLYDPTGAKQQAKDMEFAEKGKELLTALLMSCVIDIATGEHKVPSIENGYNGWYPYDTTSVFVIGPGANPEYEQPNSLWRNPWYTDPTINTNDDSANTIRQIYPNAAKTLIKMAEALVIPNAPDGRSKYYTYKRRYSNDPLHHTDDSEFIVLKPKIMSNGEVWTVMYWDDDKSRPIVRMA